MGTWSVRSLMQSLIDDDYMDEIEGLKEEMDKHLDNLYSWELVHFS
jgi:hypothetical protein